MSSDDYLPALSPNDPVRNLRTLAGAGAAIAEAITEETRAARARGYSWQAIAEALAVPGRSGRLALGDLFPGGTSETTIRRMYEAGR